MTTDPKWRRPEADQSDLGRPDLGRPDSGRPRAPRRGRRGGRFSAGAKTQLTAVGGTLNGMLEGLGLAATLKGWEAMNFWAEVVGSPANERSRAVAFDGGRLIVEVDSAVWMTQLSYLKREYQARLNFKLGPTRDGGKIIQDIQFTPRGIDRPGLESKR